MSSWLEEKLLKQLGEVQRELKETQLEINRHHKDFERISDICGRVLEDGGSQEAWNAIEKIRNIVG